MVNGAPKYRARPTPRRIDTTVGDEIEIVGIPRHEEDHLHGVDPIRSPSFSDPGEEGTKHRALLPRDRTARASSAARSVQAGREAAQEVRGRRAYILTKGRGRAAPRRSSRNIPSGSIYFGKNRLTGTVTLTPATKK